MTHSTASFAFRSSGLLLAGLLFMAPGLLTAQTQPAPVRVAIVGLVHGHVGGFLAGIPKHKDIELVGVVEPDATLRARYAKQFNLPDSILFDDTTKMIEAQHPQAVLVYTSIGDHRKIIEIAARHGVSSMVEKPLTISLDDALAIRKVAREHHVQVLVNYETTWYASNKAAWAKSAASWSTTATKAPRRFTSGPSSSTFSPTRPKMAPAPSMTSAATAPI
jgi:hypothetical protein